VAGCGEFDPQLGFVEVPEDAEGSALVGTCEFLTHEYRVVAIALVGPCPDLGIREGLAVDIQDLAFGEQRRHREHQVP
jgi:hypothetical protein